MAYTWELEAIQKYGEEVTKNLIEEQREYEARKQGNDCNGCGVNNQGYIIEAENGRIFVMHKGSFSNSNNEELCHDCGRITKIWGDY